MANSADPYQKPTDLDLHCLQRQGISGLSRTRVKLKKITYRGYDPDCLNYKYSKTLMTRTPMSCLPWMIQIRF